MSKYKVLDLFGSNRDIDKQIEYTHTIIDKLFITSMWNNGKLNAILTINGLVGAGIFVFFQQTSTSIPEYVWLLVVTALLFFIISILICLAHSIPLYDSKIGNTTNLRAIIGIIQLDKQQYFEKCTQLNKKDMLLHNCNQISGMARNNTTAQKRITAAAITTFLGFSILSISLIVFIAANVGMI